MRNPRRDLVYVYCAVRGPVTPRTLARLPPLPGGSAPRVMALTSTISLVVADVPPDDYGAGAIETRLADLDWVSRAGAAHHAVADRLAPKHTVVPFRLFTLFASDARARTALDRSARHIDAALERVTGRAEWVLRIGKPEVARGEGAVAMAGAPVAAPSGRAFLEAKAAARQAAADLAARVRVEALAVFDAASAAAADAQQRPLDEAPGLLLDAAFLVPTAQTARFKRALARAAEGLLRDGCRVSLTGPWPPYSFVALESSARRA